MRKEIFLLSALACLSTLSTQAQSDTTDTLKSQNIDEVVVVHQRQLIKNDIDKLSYDVQHDEDAKSKNTLEMLRKVPMVSVDGEDNIKVRGSQNFKIYKNGHPDPSLSGTNAKDILKALPAASIKKIEVITDPGAKYDAEGTATILNIVMADNSKMQGVAGNVNVVANTKGSWGYGGYVTTQVGKLTLAANYNYFDQNKRQAERDYEQVRDYAKSGDHHISNAHNANSANIHYGNIDASYEIDSLNLISASFNGMYYDIGFEGDGTVQRWDKDRNLLYRYRSIGSMPGYSYYDLGGRVDYQHKTRREDEVLTLSYMLATTHFNNRQLFEYSETTNMPVAYTGYEAKSSERFAEHTFQIDYVLPVAKRHKIEMGAKYINRNNNSKSTMNYFGTDDATNDLFDHNTQVAAAYLSYLYQSEKWSARAGLRYEFSYLKASYPDGSNADFHRTLNDWVPSASVQYKINDKQTAKLSFSTNIQRPGISYLNPAVISTPDYLDFGNPHLNSARNYSITASYSYITPKFSLYLYPGFGASRNSISVLQYVQDRKNVTTFGNDLHYNTASISTYIQWQPFTGTHINLNASESYVRSAIPSTGLSLHGFNGNASLNIQQKLPWKMTLDIGASGSFGRSLNSVYGFDSRYYNYNFVLTRSFVNDKLSVSLGANMPFTHHEVYKSQTVQGDYTGYNRSVGNSRYLSMRVIWRFGSLKASVKKADRTIENNDMIGGIKK